jgi:4-hydroxybenzoate polyprenyltransferase
LVLAIAFSSAVWVVYYQFNQSIVFNEIAILFVFNMLWTLLYDTQYAMADFEDDQKLSLHSSVKFFQSYVHFFNASLMFGLVMILASLTTTVWGWMMVLVSVLLFFWQWYQLKDGHWKEKAMRVFLSHMYLGGMWVFWLYGQI